MTEFEKAAWEVDKEFDNDEISNENVIEWIRGSKTVTISFTQKRFITRVHNLAQKYPDKVQIVHENSDGSIVAHLPLSAVHISIRPGREMTEEQREAAKIRLAEARKKRFGDRELTAAEVIELEDELLGEEED